MKDPVSVVSGVGPGTGSALARRLAPAMISALLQHHRDGLGDGSENAEAGCVCALCAQKKKAPQSSRGA